MSDDTDHFPVPSDTQFIVRKTDGEFSVVEVNMHGFVEVARADRLHDAFAVMAKLTESSDVRVDR